MKLKMKNEHLENNKKINGQNIQTLEQQHFYYLCSIVVAAVSWEWSL